LDDDAGARERDQAAGVVVVGAVVGQLEHVDPEELGVGRVDEAAQRDPADVAGEQEDVAGFAFPSHDERGAVGVVGAFVGGRPEHRAPCAGERQHVAGGERVDGRAPGAQGVEDVAHRAASVGGFQGLRRGVEG
jgi:hypothetical protein